jgi:hypothetical protein
MREVLRSATEGFLLTLFHPELPAFGSLFQLAFLCRTRKQEVLAGKNTVRRVFEKFALRFDLPKNETLLCKVFRRVLKDQRRRV